MKGVYLIHFDRPLHHARHYMGWSEDIDARLEAHAAGNGAALMAAVRQAGIPWRLARTWPGKDRHFERKLKNRKYAPRICPICRGEDR